MMAAPDGGGCDGGGDGDGASAKELASCAAKLRLAMQALVERNASGQAAAAQVGGGRAAGPPASPAAGAVAPAAVAMASPGMSLLAAHARELLQEIEAAAAGSSPARPVSGQHQHPEQQQQQQQRLEPRAEGPRRRLALDADAWPAPVPSDGGNPGGARQLHGSLLEDSCSWSSALRQYQQHLERVAEAAGQGAAPTGAGRERQGRAQAGPAAPAGALAAAAPPALSTAEAACAAAGRAAACLVPDGRLCNITGGRPSAGSGSTFQAVALAAEGHPGLAAQGTAAASAATGRQLAAQGRRDDGGATAEELLMNRGGSSAAGPPGQLPAAQLAARSLPGPPEDSMRCLAELQEAREEAALLRARHSRMAAAAEEGEAERAYLQAERKLLVAQLRHMAVLLAADAAAVAAGSGADGAASAAAGRACSGSSLQESALQDVSAAEQALDAAWRLLPAGSSLRFLSGPSQLSRDFAAAAEEVSAAMGRRQALLQGLQARLAESQAAAEALRLRLAGAGKAGEAALGQLAQRLESKWSRRLLKSEQRATEMAQQHQAVLLELQGRLKRQEGQLGEAACATERQRLERDRLEQRLQELEAEKQELQEVRQASSKQASALQEESRALRSALAAAEDSLREARQALEQQRALGARLEEAAQRKGLMAQEARHELKEARLAAQQASAEAALLQEQLSGLKARAAETARQLSASRTGSREATEQLQQEQRRSQEQARLLDDLRAELDHAMRCVAAAQRAQAADAKRAGAAEAEAAALRQTADSAKAAAGDALAAADAARRRLQQAEQQAKEAEHQREAHALRLAGCEAALEAAVLRAERAEAELAGIGFEVAEWAAGAWPEGGPCGRPSPASTAAATAGGGSRAAGPSMGAGTAEGQSPRPRPHPEEAVVQLAWQAGEIASLQGARDQLQAQLDEARQQLSAVSAQLATTQQQLAAAEEAVAWLQPDSAGAPQQGGGAAAAVQQQRQQEQRQRQHLERALADADARIAGLTSALEASRAQLGLRERAHELEAARLRDALAATSLRGKAPNLEQTQPPRPARPQQQQWQCRRTAGKTQPRPAPRLRPPRAGGAWRIVLGQGSRSASESSAGRGCPGGGEGAAGAVQLAEAGAVHGASPDAGSDCGSDSSSSGSDGGGGGSNRGARVSDISRQAMRTAQAVGSQGGNARRGGVPGFSTGSSGARQTGAHAQQPQLAGVRSGAGSTRRRPQDVGSPDREINSQDSTGAGSRSPEGVVAGGRAWILDSSCDYEGVLAAAEAAVEAAAAATGPDCLAGSGHQPALAV